MPSLSRPGVVPAGKSGRRRLITRRSLVAGTRMPAHAARYSRLLTCLFAFFLLIAPSLEAQPVPGVREARVAFSPRGEAADLILRELRGARQSIDVAMFYLSHDDLIDALCFMAQRRGLKIRVITGVGMATPAHMPILERLAHHGARVYVVEIPNNGRMHLKCAVIDNETVIAGAANWTTAAFDQNFEDTLIIQHRGLAQRYLNQFESLITRADELHKEFYEEPERISFPEIQRYERQRRTDRFQADRSRMVRDIRQMELYFNPGRAGIRRLLEQAGQARQSIDIGMYLLNDEEVLNALTHIAGRGAVKVRLVADSGMTGRYLSELQTLWNAGVEILYYQRDRESMHLKATVIDGRYVWTGSANWTRGALGLNVEDMLMFESPDMARHYAEFLDGISQFSESFASLALDHEVAEIEVEAEYSRTGHLIGLPLTGPRTDFRDLARDDPPLRAWDVQASVSYLPDEEYFPVLIDLIRTAHQSIFITMYVMSETVREARHQEEVVRQLARAAARGVYVYLLLHVPPSVEDRLHEAHSSWAERLRAGGIDVRLNLPGIPLHNKMVVVDLAKILIGSHNWSEGALSGGRVYESSALLVLPKQDLRLAEYAFSLNAISDMRSRELWEREISLLRHIRAMSRGDREAFIRDLEARVER